MPVFPLAPEHEPALEAFLADFDAAGEPEVPATASPTRSGASAGTSATPCAPPRAGEDTGTTS